MKYDCLIVDDEKLLADSTAEYLNLFQVKTAAVYDAQSCRNFLNEHSTQVILLDVNLADSSGFELCKELRAQTQVPIIFISARTGDDDQVIGLNIGGDDYIQKPYSLSVLSAKVKAVLKRYGAAEKSGYHDDWLRVDFTARQVWVQNQEQHLTALEYRLLFFLIEHENRVITKQELFKQVWKDKYTTDGTLNVHIRKLRQMIEKDPSSPQYIITKWGEGYQFCGGKQ